MRFSEHTIGGPGREFPPTQRMMVPFAFPAPVETAHALLRSFHLEVTAPDAEVKDVAVVLTTHFDPAQSATSGEVEVEFQRTDRSDAGPVVAVRGDRSPDPHPGRRHLSGRSTRRPAHSTKRGVEPPSLRQKALVELDGGGVRGNAEFVAEDLSAAAVGPQGIGSTAELGLGGHERTPRRLVEGRELDGLLAIAVASTPFRAWSTPRSGSRGHGAPPARARRRTVRTHGAASLGRNPRRAIDTATVAFAQAASTSWRRRSPSARSIALRASWRSTLLALRQSQFVAPGTGDDRRLVRRVGSSQQDAELADDRRQRARGVVRRIWAPHAIDELVGGDRTPLLQAEPGERQASLPTRKVPLVDGTVAADHGDPAAEVDP